MTRHDAVTLSRSPSEDDNPVPVLVAVKDHGVTLNHLASEHLAGQLVLDGGLYQTTQRSGTVHRIESRSREPLLRSISGLDGCLLYTSDAADDTINV